jgi:hypothetical protein
MLLNEEKNSIKGIEFICINSAENVKMAREDTAFVEKGATSPTLNNSSVHIAV